MSAASLLYGIPFSGFGSTARYKTYRPSSTTDKTKDRPRDEKIAPMIFSSKLKNNGDEVGGDVDRHVQDVTAWVRFKDCFAARSFYDNRVKLTFTL